MSQIIVMWSLGIVTIIIIFLMFEIWTESDTNRASTDEYARSGISWDVAVHLVLENESVFIVKSTSKFDRAVVWVCDPIDPDDRYAAYDEIRRSGRLTSPPEELSTESSLVERFGKEKVFIDDAIVTR